MKLLWLDDSRDPMKDNWLIFSPILRNNISEVIWIKKYYDFISYIKENGLPDGICFDHDLGQDIQQSAITQGMSKTAAKKLKKGMKTGMDCAKWLVEYCLDNNLKLPLYNIQSSNPAGKANIDSLLKSFNKTTNLKQEK